MKQKITPWGRGLGSDEVGQKSLKLPLLWFHPQKSSKTFHFFSRNYKTRRIFQRVWTAL